MIITCESCGTKFKIDPSKVGNKDTIRVRCSRCRHVFAVNLKSEEEAKKSEKVIVLDDSLGEEIEKIAGTSSPDLSMDSGLFEKEEEETPARPVSEPVIRKKKMTKTGRKHVPIRTCIVCRAKKPKKDLLRLALTPEGAVVLDVSQRMSGRGAYVCHGCLQKLKWDKRLERAFRGRAKELSVQIINGARGGV